MSCDCIEKVNDQLRLIDEELKLCPTIDIKTGESGKEIAVLTVGTKKGVKGRKLFPKFCPFCGRPDSLAKERQITNLVWLSEEEAKAIPAGSHVMVRVVNTNQYRYSSYEDFQPDWIERYHYYRKGGDWDGKSQPEAQFALIPEVSSFYKNETTKS